MWVFFPVRISISFLERKLMYKRIGMGILEGVPFSENGIEVTVLALFCASAQENADWLLLVCPFCRVLPLDSLFFFHFWNSVPQCCYCLPNKSCTGKFCPTRGDQSLPVRKGGCAGWGAWSVQPSASATGRVDGPCSDGGCCTACLPVCSEGDR